jgi:hypothetical protein
MSFSLLVDAQIYLGNLSGSIEKEYSPSENIRGWINISIINELYDTLVKGSSDLKGGIRLIDLLKTNNLEYGEDYECDTIDCLTYYKIIGDGETSNTFSLTTGEEKVLAFNIDGDYIKSISSLSFNINVNNEVSCINPLEIDFLPDADIENPIIEWKSTKFSQTDICSNFNKYGCFDKLASSQTEVGLSRSENHCEKVRLTPSNYYNLGAIVRNTSLYPENGDIRMSLHDLSGTEIALCTLDFSKTLGESEYYCNAQLKPGYSIDYESEYYYVCIKKTSDENTYYIKSENSGEKCGFFETPDNAPETFLYDYSIFAESYKFDNIGKIVFNEIEYENQGNEYTLAEDLDFYLGDKYDFVCENGCAIPIKFKANIGMDITISNISLKYNTNQGEALPSDRSYEVQISKPKISFNYTKLDLDESNITVPSKYGNYNVSIYVGSEKIKTESIKVLKVPVIKNLYPTIVSAGYPTEFVVEVETQDNKSIINYTWNFGDGTIKETTTDKVAYSYQKINIIYPLKIKVTDSEGLSSEKTFAISVGSPKEAINKTLETYTKRIQNLTSQISSFSSPYQIFLKKSLNLENTTLQLQELQKQYNSAGGDEKIYLEIMNKLATLNVPYKIDTTSKGDLPYYVNYQKINLDTLKEAGAGDYLLDNPESYKKAIGGWQQELVLMNIHYEYISAYYDSGVSQLIGIFKLKLSPNSEIKGEETENYLVFSDAIRGTNFDISDSSYNIKQINQDVAIKFSNINEREILFYYKGEKLYNNLDVYPSPKFSELDVNLVLSPCNYNRRCEKGETWKNCREDCKPWRIAWVLWIILFFIACIVYLIISQWYRIHYESKLFKDRHDIYNLLNFIDTAIHQGLIYNTIRQKLKEMSWTNEQISYVINKYQGKSIVPFDISKIFSRKGNKNKTKEPTKK